jgi:peptidoglycan-associated lipoprotein
MDSGSALNATSNIRPGSLSDFQQNVGDRVFFDYDQHTLSSEGESVLGSQVEWMKKYAEKNQIVIEGHCDERGTREYNLALGARRANSVKSFLISHGVPARQIKTISYGKERPEIQSSDESSWGKNRRAVTVLVDYSNS